MNGLFSGFIVKPFRLLASVVVHFLFYACCAFASSGAFIFMYQVFKYLKEGEWVSVSVIDLMAWLGIDWALSPHDWFGLYKVVDAVPAVIGNFFVGIVLASLVAIMGLLAGIHVSD